jgi:HEAT repeat protein
MYERLVRADEGREAATRRRVELLVAALAHKDGGERLHAREQLVEIGNPAVPALIEALGSPSENVRWEAAKALGMIRDPRAASALVDALEDPEPAVRWLAAKALIALGRAGLVAVLRGVERCVDDTWMKEGTIHVLHTWVREGVVPEALPVLEALEEIQPRIEAPVAAYHLLQSLAAVPEWSAVSSPVSQTWDGG